MSSLQLRCDNKHIVANWHISHNEKAELEVARFNPSERLDHAFVNLKLTHWEPELFQFVSVYMSVEQATVLRDALDKAVQLTEGDDSWPKEQ